MPLASASRAALTDEKRRRSAPVTILRGRWLAREWNRSPNTYATYAYRLAAVQKRFGVGVVAAQQAHAHALQLFRERGAESVTLDNIVARMNDLAEHAEAMGKYGDASRVLRDMALITGVAVPRKIEHSLNTNTGATVQQLAHVNLLGMTPAQQRNREAELEAKEARMSAANAALASRSAPAARDTGNVIDADSHVIDVRLAVPDDVIDGDEADDDDESDDADPDYVAPAPARAKGGRRGDDE